MIKDITDLGVYNESLQLIAEVYIICNKISYTELALKDQIKRSAYSVPANLAEGFAKRWSDKEFRRYILISLASSDETISHLRTLIIVCPNLQPKVMVLLNKYKELSKRINTLHKNWQFKGRK